MLRLNRDKLISAVYSATLSPVGYDEAMETIDHLIFGDLASGHGDKASEDANGFAIGTDKTPPVIDPQIASHFQLAQNIQLRVGHQNGEKPKALMLLDAAPGPAYIVDQDENIIAMNGHAEHKGKGKFQKLNTFADDPDVLKDLRACITSDQEEKLLVFPSTLNRSENISTCFLLRKIDADSVDGLKGLIEPVGNAFFLMVVDLRFEKSKTELFRYSYGLTPAEVDIAVHLAGGRQLTEIAVERGATIPTIRTQIKSIKRKTGSRDIPAIVRLLCGYSAGMLISSQLSSPPLPINSKSALIKSRHQITLRDGRRMIYLQQGNPNGTAVVMFHNLPYGIELPKMAIEAANRLNLRILAPYRPGHGDSDMLENAHGDKWLDEVAADVYELLDQLAIPRAIILGHTIGSIYALRFAKRFPNRVSHLFAVSRPPIWRKEWIEQLPRRQRLGMRIALYLPQMLPLIMQATAAFIRNGDTFKVVQTFCEDSPVDIEVIKNPEIRDLIVQDTRDGMKQGAAAVCQDVLLSTRDFTDDARSLNKTFYILHGEPAGVVSPSQSQAFAEQVPGTRLEIVPGAGNLLMYSH